MNIRTNDTVIVLSGKDKGRKGKVLKAMPSENKVIVEGINVATCHTKPRKQGDVGGIVHREIPIRADKVMLICPSPPASATSWSSVTARTGTFPTAPARSAARRSERGGAE